MPKYDVEMIYRCETTYNGTITVSAKDEAEAEEKAMERCAALMAPPRDWETNEDGGDFEIESVSEAE